MKKIWRRVALILLCVFLVASAAVYFIADALLNEVDRFVPEVEDTTVGTEKAENAHPVKEGTDNSEAIGNVLNILLIGQSSKRKDTKLPCDAVILCSIDRAENTVTLTSFHSDCWVDVPGKYEQSLRMTGAIGGVGLLERTLESDFGVKADYNIVVNMSGFTKIIDRLGGVSLNLLQGEADCLNDYADDCLQQSWSLRQGENTLTGEQAYHYSRMTQSNTDYGRSDRQKRVLFAMLQSMKAMSLTQMQDLAVEIAKMVSTDMTDQQIIQLVVQIAPRLKDAQIINKSIPMEGQYTLVNKNNTNVLVMSETQLSEVRKQIAEIIK